MSAATQSIRILFIGQTPETVDFSDPVLPPGLDAAKIHAGIQTGMRLMIERGWQADLTLVAPDDSAVIAVETQLGKAHYDCVVIGGGLRMPPKSLPLFERLVNVVHRAAPECRIAFNSKPEDTADAAARWVTTG